MPDRGNRGRLEDEDYDEEEMEELNSPRQPRLSRVLSTEIQALACTDDGVHNFVIFLLLVLSAIVVIGRMVYRDLHHDWGTCEEGHIAKHFYCVNTSAVQNLLAVTKKPFRPKDD